MQTNNFGVKISQEDKGAASRKEAKERGLTVYSSSEPCKRGHTGLRYTSSGECRTCTKIRNNKKHGFVTDLDISEKRRAIEDHQSRKRDEYDF